jgi:hypothetical protein
MPKSRTLTRHASILAAASILLAGVVSAGEATVEKSATVVGQGTLRLAIPKSWRMETRAEKDGGTRLEFAPANGDDFRVLLTVLVPRREDVTPSDLRQTVEQSARGLLAQAEEKALDVKELKGSDVSGFYFSLTDTDPGDSYKYMTAGQFRVGKLLAVMTVLHRTAGDVKDAALEVVRTAALVK